MWEELRRVGEIAAGAQGKDPENVPFSAEERMQIAAQLKEIKESLRKTYFFQATSTLQSRSGWMRPKRRAIAWP